MTQPWSHCLPESRGPLRTTHCPYYLLSRSPLSKPVVKTTRKSILLSRPVLKSTRSQLWSCRFRLPLPSLCHSPQSASTFQQPERHESLNEPIRFDNARNNNRTTEAGKKKEAAHEWSTVWERGRAAEGKKKRTVMACEKPPPTIGNVIVAAIVDADNSRAALPLSPDPGIWLAQ